MAVENESRFALRGIKKREEMTNLEIISVVGTWLIGAAAIYGNYLNKNALKETEKFEKMKMGQDLLDRLSSEYGGVPQRVDTLEKRINHLSPSLKNWGWSARDAYIYIYQPLFAREIVDIGPENYCKSFPNFKTRCWMATIMQPRKEQ